MFPKSILSSSNSLAVFLAHSHTEREHTHTLLAILRVISQFMQRLQRSFGGAPASEMACTMLNLKTGGAASGQGDLSLNLCHPCNHTQHVGAIKSTFEMHSGQHFLPILQLIGVFTVLNNVLWRRLRFSRMALVIPEIYSNPEHVWKYISIWLFEGDALCTHSSNLQSFKVRAALKTGGLFSRQHLHIRGSSWCCSWITFSTSCGIYMVSCQIQACNGRNILGQLMQQKRNV